MNDAERAESYRNKAEEIRAIAEAMTDGDAKKVRDMAADYLQMAKTLDQIAAQKPRLSSKP